MGYINKLRQPVIAARFDRASAFSEGLAAVQLDGRFSFIDHHGKAIVPFRFIWAADFAEGAARVIETGVCLFVGHGHCAFANPTILGLPREEWGSFGQYRRCRYSFIDRRGHLLFAQQFMDAYDFSEGYAVVFVERGYGFIDKTGTMRITPKFESAQSFHEGLAAVRLGGKWGYIDRTGRIVIRPQYTRAGEFSDGAAIVGINDYAVQFIDKAGKPLFGRRFHAATPFRLGLAHVAGPDGMAYIDRGGRAIFKY